MTRWLHGGAIVAAIALVWACAASGERTELATASARGAELFARHCTFCHGPDGRGDGEAARFVSPAPRDFGSGQFRLVSSRKGVPTDDDLARTLRRGMPGSVMPSFAWMDDEDIAALTRQVRHLAVQGMTADLEDLGVRGEDARRIAADAMTPVRPFDDVANAAVDPVRGRLLYLEHCANCHGEDGSGSRPYSVWDEQGRFQWARDFTAGVLKGGTSTRELSWRVRAGMPGSTMIPAALDDPAEVAAVVAHVQTLLRPGAEERLVQTRRTITAVRVDELPISPHDPVWQQAIEVELPLAPLTWLDDSILTAWVAAVHEGEHLALRVRWVDPTRDDNPLGPSRLADAVAVQFSSEREPPAFGMGAPDHPVNIWHWKPFDPEDVSALLELGPHRDPALRGGTDAPIYLPVLSEAQSVDAEGPESAREFADRHGTISALSEWNDGEWRVMFVRPVKPLAAGQPEFTPGNRLHLALAVWNGRARDHDAQKSATVWHGLEIRGVR